MIAFAFCSLRLPAGGSHEPLRHPVVTIVSARYEAIPRRKLVRMGSSIREVGGEGRTVFSIRKCSLRCVTINHNSERLDVLHDPVIAAFRIESSDLFKTTCTSANCGIFDQARTQPVDPTTLARSATATFLDRTSLNFQPVLPTED